MAEARRGARGDEFCVALFDAEAGPGRRRRLRPVDAAPRLAEAMERADEALQAVKDRRRGDAQVV